LKVLQDADFAPAGFANLASVLDVLANGTGPGQFGQVVVTTGLDLGNGTTGLQVRLGFDPMPGDTFQILVNNSNTLTAGRLRDQRTGALLGEGATFNAIGPSGEDVPFNITYTAGDGNEVQITRNTPAMIADAQLTPTVLNEGGVVSFSGRLVDPDANAQLFLTIDWGDGSPVETLRPGRQPFTLYHRYRDDDPSGTPSDQYVVRFTWGDGSGQARSDSRLVTVNNVAPVMHAGGDAVLRAGGELVRAGFFTDPGADRWAATVDYGDGTGSQHLDLRPDGTFALRHHYRRPGTYLVTVRVVDDDGGTGANAFSVTVESRPGGRDVDALDAVFRLLGTDGEEGVGRTVRRSPRG
jgi:hypothetical protein